MRMFYYKSKTRRPFRKAAPTFNIFQESGIFAMMSHNKTAAMTAALLLLCTACGQGTANTSDTTEASSAAVVSETTAEATEEAAEEVTEEVSEETSQQETTAETTETEKETEAETTEKAEETTTTEVTSEAKEADIASLPNEVHLNVEGRGKLNSDMVSAVLSYYGINCTSDDIAEANDVDFMDVDSMINVINSFLESNGESYEAVDMSGYTMADIAAE